MTPAEEARLHMRLAALEADKRLLDAIDLAKRLKAAQCQLREFRQKRIKEKGMHITIHPLRDNFIAPRYVSIHVPLAEHDRNISYIV